MFREMTLLVLLGTLLYGCAAGAADFKLASGGKTTYVIVVDPAASETDKYAAQELAGFLKQVTGADFPVQETATAAAGPMLVVGAGAVQQKLAPALKLDELKTDGIVIEPVGTSLILAGDKPRGAMYAVYTFLEDTVGCRWWSSKASTIPNRPELTVSQERVRYIPPLEYREPFWFDAFDGDFSARNKANGHHHRVSAQQGGNWRYGGKSFVHTFDWLMPPSKYAAEHPEYYSERDGKRIVADVPYCQLCVTNPDVKRIVTEEVFKVLEENPNANIVSISQNDVDQHCLCAECKRIEDEEGSPMGPLLLLVNHVAAAVADKYPHVAIDTLAYQYTRKPPKTIKPLPNVIIRLCSIECDFAQPLTSETNKTFADDIRGWNKICNRLYIWDYTTNFGHYIQPHPNLRVLGPNVRFFVDNGVKGLFEQGAYQSHGAEMAELRAWVLAKLLWNPRLDDRKLIDEFIDGYFGPAAAPIRQYLTMLHDSVEETKTYLAIWVPPSSPYLSFDVMSKAEALFNQAEAAVKDDPVLLNRVQVARLPLRYVWGVRWFEFQAQAKKQKVAWPGPADYLENHKTFMDLCEANNITKLSEGRPVEAFGVRTVELNRAESPVPPGCENLPEDAWIDLQDMGFNLWNEGTAATLTHDPEASDKVGCKMPGNHHEWAAQQLLAVADLDPEVEYDVYVSVKCEKAGEEGLGFTSGIYDVKNKQFVAQISVDCKDIKSDKYETYKVARTKLHDQVYLWCAPPKNPDNMKFVWVDRYWLVKAQ